MAKPKHLREGWPLSPSLAINQYPVLFDQDRQGPTPAPHPIIINIIYGHVSRNSTSVPHLQTHLL